jgi:TPR repeat protein
MYEIMDVELGLIWGSDAISGVLSHLLPKVFTFLIRQEQTDDDLVRDVLHHIIHEIPFLLQDSEASDQDLSRFTELLTLSEDFLVTMTEKATDERIKLRLIDGLAELNEETASSAYYGLAEKYYRGENYSIDLDKAAKLYTKAAECGHVKAQQKLSHLYSKGLGVQKDLEKAIIWNGKALKQLMKIYGEKHRLTILCYNAQAWFYFLNGNYETALKHSLKATRSFPDDMKPVQKANCLDTLANIYEALHCQSDAIKSYELCLELYRNLFGDNDSRCETLANKIKELNESNSHSS